MGCTHYPILEPVLKKTMSDGVSIVNTGKETAKEVKRTLERADILNDSGKGKQEYYVTDSPESFAEIGGRFLGEHIANIKFVKNLEYKDFLLST
jgi:glutamate racemase